MANAKKYHMQGSGHGFTAKTACGRNYLAAHISVSKERFLSLPDSKRCEKCSAKLA